MFEKKFCPYCGAHINELHGCRCAIEIDEYEAERFAEIEEISLQNAWQQDIIDMYRREK